MVSVANLTVLFWCREGVSISISISRDGVTLGFWDNRAQAVVR